MPDVLNWSLCVLTQRCALAPEHFDLACLCTRAYLAPLRLGAGSLPCTVPLHVAKCRAALAPLRYPLSAAFAGETLFLRGGRVFREQKDSESLGEPLPSLPLS